MDQAKLGFYAAVGLGVVLALYLWWPTSDAKPAVAATCPSILPTGATSNGYAFYATDNNGDFAYGVLHFYPNGFRHNAAILFDQSNSPSTNSVALFDVAVPGGCVPADGGPATLTLSRDGTPAAVLHFSSPASDPNAAFAITFASNGSVNSQNPIPAIPQSPMTGNAYLIGNQ